MKLQEQRRKSQPNNLRIYWPHSVYFSIYRIKGNENNYLDFFESPKKEAKAK